MTFLMQMRDSSAVSDERLPVPFKTPLPQLVRRTLASSAYLLLSWPIHLALFCINVTLLSISLSVVLAPVALPPAIAVAAAGAALERRLIEKFVGMPAPAARPLSRRTGETLPAYAVRAAGSPQVWLDVAWSMIAWIVSTITWIISLSWWAAALAGITWPIYGWALHNRGDNQDLAELIGLHSYPLALVFNVVLGLFFLATLPAVNIGLARVQGLFATSMLCRIQQEEQIKELTQTRDAGRAAESAQLSRLERDIHDGPQQRLVRLKMDLARMERQLGDDSHAVMGLRAAIASTQETLDELRALSKGIAPPVLADRGLVAAVREAAGRSMIPVSVEADLGEVAALPPHIEQAAYFVVTEALTNVAKHSNATQGLVSLQVSGGDLLVSVTDDGQGGAHPSKGQGILGLQNRVRSVGGTLTIESPVGGPTTIMGAFPLI
ncbi:sensor histidine kinase [Flexivirga meconopsidis]|uniref:sensor histidine kinase n=1 Tax=Flexivirga meconopsidis TaxID=2977121 RepID=UPI00223FE26F|nr:sensor domain-containing protein [Flexivirga meconopsidis]